MRIAQIIDSLDTGGAERMAVNYANALSSQLDFSGLVTTRKEGSLKTAIRGEVAYLYLRKSSKLDPNSVWRLRSYCKENKVTHLHAHGSSYFTSALLKVVYPRIKLIWHVHNGSIASLPRRELRLLKVASCLFSGIITVNNTLKEWAKAVLHCRHVVYLPNFIDEPAPKGTQAVMHGLAGKRVVIVANLRHPKNHELLLEAAKQLHSRLNGWTFHVVGKDYADQYSRYLRDFIEREKLEDTVYLYGSQNDAASFIAQSDIAVLTSHSEGLPLALLEYGLHAKPVVVTRVGEIPLIVKDGENGFLVEATNVMAFSDALFKLMSDAKLREALGSSLRETIRREHSQNAVIGKYRDWLKKV